MFIAGLIETRLGRNKAKQGSYACGNATGSS